MPISPQAGRPALLPDYCSALVSESEQQQLLDSAQVPVTFGFDRWRLARATTASDPESSAALFILLFCFVLFCSSIKQQKSLLDFLFCADADSGLRLRRSAVPSSLSLPLPHHQSTFPWILRRRRRVNCHLLIPRFLFFSLAFLAMPYADARVFYLVQIYL